MYASPAIMSNYGLPARFDDEKKMEDAGQAQGPLPVPTPPLAPTSVPPTLRNKKIERALSRWAEAVGGKGMGENGVGALRLPCSSL